VGFAWARNSEKKVTLEARISAGFDGVLRNFLKNAVKTQG